MPRQITGTVRMLNLDKGFGFIQGTDGREYFFHRSAVLEFARLEQGDAVRFVPGEGAKGPRAEEVERV